MIDFKLILKGIPIKKQGDRLKKISDKLKVSDINKIWRQIKDKVIRIVKVFFYEKEYEKLGSGNYLQLSPKWTSQKDPAYTFHFFINHEDMMNSIKGKTVSGTIDIKTTGIYAQRYDLLKDIRPVVDTNKDYIIKKAEKIFLEELKKDLGL